MTPINSGSNSVASQVYSGVQRNDTSDANRAAKAAQPNREAPSKGFQVPQNATPRGDWVLSENANPQSFESNAPRGSYLNLVV